MHPIQNNRITAPAAEAQTTAKSTSRQSLSVKSSQDITAPPNTSIPQLSTISTNPNVTTTQQAIINAAAVANALQGTPSVISHVSTTTSRAALPPLLAGEESSQLHELISEAGPKTKDQLDKSSSESKQWIQRREMFLEQVKDVRILTPNQTIEIINIKNTQGEKVAKEKTNEFIADNLENYVFAEPEGVDRFTTSELTHLFHNFCDLGNFNALDRMMTSSSNSSFTANTINGEFHARMALKTNPPNPHYAILICKQQMENAIKSGKNMTDSGFKQLGELHSVSAQAKKMQITSANKFILELEKKERDPKLEINKKVVKEYITNFGLPSTIDIPTVSDIKERVHDLQKQQEKSLSNAFFSDMEPIHGVSLGMLHLSQAQPKIGDSIFQISELSCLNRGVWESSDPENAMSMMIATMAQGKELSNEQLAHLSNVIHTGSKDPGTNYIADTLDSLSKLSKAGRISPNALSNAEFALKNPTPQIKNSGTPQEKLRGMSYNYQAIMSNYVSGNFRFGGLLYSSHLNRTDKEVFEQLVDTPMGTLIDKNRSASYQRIQQLENALGPNWEQMKMQEIDDPLELMAVLDLFTRQSFHNEELEMENLHSSGHKIFENATNKLFDAGGMSDSNKRKQIDGANSPMPGSRTNPSVALSIGLGDCRQHAQTKQMLFDSWRRVKVHASLRDAHRFEQAGDHANAQDSLTKANQLAKVDLRTFDVIVKAPVKMTQKYDPLMDANGQHLMTDTGSYEEIEDHTMNILMIDDKAYFADSFYQDHEFYHWGAGEVDLTQFENEGVINAGDLKAIDQLGNERSLPIHLVPTPYAGKRDIYQQGSGETFILGIPTQVDIIPTLTLENRGNRLAMINSFV